jgi:excisionase family DNA binding protein
MMEERLEKVEVLPHAIYSYKELAEMVGVSLRKFYEWARETNLPSFRVGRKYAILGEDFLAHIKGLAYEEEFPFPEEG